MKRTLKGGGKLRSADHSRLALGQSLPLNLVLLKHAMGWGRVETPVNITSESQVLCKG